MKMTLLILLPILIGCQTDPSTSQNIEVDASSQVIWTAGCADYGCAISTEELPSGPVFFKVLWCCPFLDRAAGSVTLRGVSGNDPWVSTTTEYQCGTTATFLASPLFSTIDVSMQPETRREIANQCSLTR